MAIHRLERAERPDNSDLIKNTITVECMRNTLISFSWTSFLKGLSEHSVFSYTRCFLIINLQLCEVNNKFAKKLVNIVGYTSSPSITTDINMRLLLLKTVSNIKRTYIIVIQHRWRKFSTILSPQWWYPYKYMFYVLN